MRHAIHLLVAVWSGLLVLFVVGNALAQEQPRPQGAPATADRLQKVLAEDPALREGANPSERKPPADSKDAEGATPAPDDTIAKKPAAKETSATLAAPPKKGRLTGSLPFDGSWTVTWRAPDCDRKQGTYTIKIQAGFIDQLQGALAPSGKVRWRTIKRGVYYYGTLGAASGSGSFKNPHGCKGTWTATRK